MKASEAIASEIDYDALLLRLLQITIENAGAQRGVLVLRKDVDFIVVADSLAGRMEQRLQESKVCPSQLLMYVARSSNALVFEDGTRRRTFRDEAYFHENAVRSVLACPIMRNGQLIGMVYLENNAVAGVFTHERLATIQMLLGPAAIALENAELYQEQKRYTEELELRVSERTSELEQVNAMLARLADIDSLTHIANRRSFDRECARLAADASAAALILCDVDDFKAYNDHYGHPAGDRVLQQVAAVIAGIPMPVPGLVTRYGGEEFAILLQTANAAQALEFAALIVRSIADLAIPHSKARATNYVTMSLGVTAIAHLSASSIPTLITTADEALYKAKANGRNQVVASAICP
jgi:diguanylate cyclase (GGDEF)-like protein